MDIYFKDYKDKPFLLQNGLCYYDKQPLLELQTGTYDVDYFIILLNQCKNISKTLPYHINCIGLKTLNNGYQLIVN
jgi:hypothetical protein